MKFRKFVMSFVMAATLASVVVVGADHGRAYADYTEAVKEAPALISTAAGTGTVVTGCLASGVCEAAAAIGVVAVLGGVAIWGARQIHLFGWGSKDVEKNEYIGPSTTTTYAKGCWSSVFTVAKTCNGTTKQVPEDGITGLAVGVTWTFTIEKGAAQNTNNDISVGVQWSGGASPLSGTGNTDRRVVLDCSGGSSGYDVEWDVAAAVNGAAPATAGKFIKTFPYTDCATKGGVSRVMFLYRPCCGGEQAVYQFLPNVTPETPVEVVAPAHRWKALKVCHGNDGTDFTITAVSAQFKEADPIKEIPAYPNPACPSGSVAKSWTVYEGDANGNGTSTVMLTWTAPDALTDGSLVEYSDCLPGGSAAPCVVKLLRRSTTTAPWIECVTGGIDCSSFDPATSDPDLYRCTWGSHVVPLTECRTAPKTYVENQIQNEVGVADPATQTDTGTETSKGPQDVETATDPEQVTTSTSETFTECVGGVTWNPINWVMKPIICALKWAFIPRQDHLADVQDAYNGSVVQSLGQPVTVVKDSVDVFRSSVQGGDGDCRGPTASVPMFGSSPFTFEPLNSCSGPAQTAAGTVRTGLSFVFLVLGGIAVARVVLGAFGFKVLSKQEEAAA